MRENTTIRLIHHKNQIVGKHVPDYSASLNLHESIRLLNTVLLNPKTFDLY